MAVWTVAQCSDEPGVAFPKAVFVEARVERWLIMSGFALLLIVDGAAVLERGP